jgi:hypothetical protein
VAHTSFLSVTGFAAVARSPDRIAGSAKALSNEDRV